MDNSKRFSYAHKVARQTVAIVGNYQIAFTIALRDTYKPKKPVTIHEPAICTIVYVLSVIVVLLATFNAYGVSINAAALGMAFCAPVLVVTTTLSVIVCRIVSKVFKLNLLTVWE